MLQVPPPEAWQPAPGLGDTTTTKHYRQKELMLTVRAEPCSLKRCHAGDTVIYTQVEELP